MALRTELVDVPRQNGPATGSVPQLETRTLSTSQEPPPPYVPPSISSSSQTTPPLIQHATLSSDPQSPQNLPPPQLQASGALAPQSGHQTMFAGAHHFTINHALFNQSSPVGSGITELLRNSMPDAFHDSAARDPPPKCHHGTRKEYIAMITDWALGNSDHKEPVLWMRGPFGIGKSAVAQSCAEALQLQNKLAATLFFSRSNAGRDGPPRVFTSIAYQIATRCPPFWAIVDARIRNDPALATKSLSTQFDELLVFPLREMGMSGIDGHVVVIDGLDEYRGSSEQCAIINVIAASARDRTTPFRWFITSRPEEHIVQTMRSPNVSSVSFRLELPVSRKIDHEIRIYLTDEFEKIRARHGLAVSWPSEDVLVLLVDRTAGLWIYVTTIVRFIVGENPLGPQGQLQIAVQFAKDMSARGGSSNPLSEMDFFYALIMQQLLPETRTLVRKILLLHSTTDSAPSIIAGVLGLPEEQFRHLCASIQSVMELQGAPFDSSRLHFYHASFLDFMENPARSMELCIYGEFLNENRREYLGWLHQVCSLSTGPSHIVFPSEIIFSEGWSRDIRYHHTLHCFWRLCAVPDNSINNQTAMSLEKLQFQMMLRLTGFRVIVFTPSDVQYIRANLPTELRNKIIRRNKCPIPRCTNAENVWIFGHGDNMIVVNGSPFGDLSLKNYQDPPPGQCFCGSKLRRRFIFW